MKKTIFLPAVFAFSFCACNNESSTETSTKDSLSTQQVVNDNSSNVQVDAATQQFATDAAIAGMEEIELGNMAKSKTKNEQVMAFANMMVTDHTAAANDLKDVASANNIMLPAELPADKKDHIEMMKKKEGKDFDKHYMDMMAEGHSKVVDEFKKASTDLKNDAVKNFATRTLPTLEKHLASAKDINKKL